jgi:hypothetical protein
LPRSFQIICPSLRPCITFHVTCWFLMVGSCWPCAQQPSYRTTICQLFAIAYSIYLQLPSISGGHLLHPQPRMCHAMVTGTHSQLNDRFIPVYDYITEVYHCGHYYRYCCYMPPV